VERKALIRRIEDDEPDDLGLAAARLVVALLMPTGQPVTVAIDDTLFRRRGKKVWAAAWFRYGSAQGLRKTGRGNNWVVAAVVVTLPFSSGSRTMVCGNVWLCAGSVYSAITPTAAFRRARTESAAEVDATASC
jgi:hypothetical protein